MIFKQINEVICEQILVEKVLTTGIAKKDKNMSEKQNKKTLIKKVSFNIMKN